MDTDSPPRGRRRLLVAAVVLLALLGASAAVVQTGWGFEHVVLPLARRLLPGDLSVAAGRLSLGGGLTLEDARYEAPALSASADHLDLELALGSFAFGDRPRVDVLEARGVDVRVGPGEDGDEAPDTAEAEAPAGEEAPSLRLPVSIGRARLDDVTVTLVGADGGATVMGPIAGRADAIAPGSEGRLALRVPFRLNDASGVTTREGFLDVDVSLEEPLDPPAEAPFTLAVVAELGARGEDAPATAGDFRLEAELSGRLAPGGAVTLADSPIRLARGGEPLATLTPAGALGLGEGRAQLDVGLDVPALGASLERAGVALPEPLPQALASVPLGGELALQIASDGYAATGALTLEGVSLPDAEGQPTSVSLIVRPDVRVDPSFSRFEIGESRVEVRDGGELGVAGLVELGDDATHVDVDVDTEGLHLAPWWLLLARSPLRGLGTLPTQAHLSLELQRDGTFSLDGRERLGVKTSAGDTATVTLEHQIEGALDGPVRFVVDSTGPGVDGEGSLHLEGRVSTGAPGRLELRGELASVDLTPFAPVLLGEAPDAAAASDGEERSDAEPAADAAPAAGAGADAASPLPELDVDVAIGALRLRDLTLRGGRLRVGHEEGAWRVVLEPTALNQGRLALRYEHARGDATQRLSWRVDAESIDLASLLSTLSSGSSGQLVGRLDLASEVAGEVPLEADPFDAADGTLSLRLYEGRAQGLSLLQFIASKVGMSEFGDLTFDGVAGEFPVRKGVAEIEGLEIDGDVVHLVIGGELGVRGADLRINPRIGPGLAPAARGRFAGALLGTTSGLLALPILVTVRGPWSELGYFARPAAPAQIGAIFGGVFDAASAVANGVRAVAPGGSAPGDAAPSGAAPEPPGAPAAGPPAEPPAETPAAGPPAEPPAETPAAGPPAEPPAETPAAGPPAEPPAETPAAGPPAEAPAETPAAGPPAELPAETPGP